MDSYSFLTQSKQAILEGWLAELKESSSIYAGMNHKELNSYCHSFLETLAQTVKHNDLTPDALTEWVLRDSQSRQISLADIEQLIAGLRLTLIITLPTDDIIELLRYLDKAMTRIIDVFAVLPESALAQQMSEIEAIAHELALANEEADRALVQLQSLYDVSRQLSANLNVAKVMEGALNHLVSVTYADSGIIWLQKGSGWRPGSTCRLPADLVKKLTVSIQADTLAVLDNVREPEVFLVQSAGTAPGQFDQWLLHKLQANVLITIPLTFQDKILGVMTLQGTDKRLQADRDLARAVAQQTAVALQNGQLYEEVQQLNQTLEQRIERRTRELAQEKERLETMYQISTHLTSTLDLNQLLNQTLRQLAETIGARNGTIMLNEDASSNKLLCKASLNNNAKQRRLEKTSELLSHWVMSSQQAIITDDLHHDDRWRGHFNGTRSAVAAPLKADTDLHGVLVLTDPDPRHFTPSHLRLVEAVAMQLATAINNARLHAYIREQVVRLGDLLRVQAVESGQKHAILSSITGGVIACDNNGRVLLVNPAAEKILGKPSEYLVGEPVETIFETFEPAGRKKILESLQILQQQKKREEVMFANDIPEVILEVDRRVIRARLSVAYTPTIEMIGVVTVLHDITKEVEADRAKSEFIATVSHELRTPMTSIIGYTELLSRNVLGALDEQQKKILGIVQRNADRLASLINDLLDVSRIEAGRIILNLQQVDLRKLCEEVIEALHLAAQKKNLSLTISAPATLPAIQGDWDRITQIVTNLVNNAIAYTESGGVHISLEVEADTVQVSVQDTGVGIKVDELNQVFDRFYRSDHEVVQANSGSGLGLPIVKSFVEMHGGRIWVESTPNEGSTFSFILPISG